MHKTHNMRVNSMTRNTRRLLSISILTSYQVIHSALQQKLFHLKMLNFRSWSWLENKKICLEELQNFKSCMV